MSSKRSAHRKKPKVVGGEGTAPSPQEWANMTPYGCFTVTAQDGQEVAFSVQDTAAVLPGGTSVGTQIPYHKYWVVKILAIRGRHPQSKRRARSNNAETPQIWVRVNWFYSRHEVSYKIKGFNPAHCSDYERIYSDHSEIISALTFDALAPVIKFREDDPQQEPIGNEDFFVRYYLKTSSAQCEIESYASSSAHGEEFPGCICGRPYDVKDANPLHVMHMCPRPHCRRFYHSSCLLEHGYWITMTDPLIRVPCTESPYADKSPSTPKYKLRSSSSFRSPSSCRSPSSSEVVALLPFNLLLLAGQPIVRGAGLPSLSITGNARDVVYARSVVSAALQGGPVPNAWEDSVDLIASVVDGSLPLLKLEDTDKLLTLTCPNCSAPV
ncbi:hypothetical protein C8R47DRAFT_1208300 [Mycena vitilis]|nr:hypothetical protein C8R47DRAFT_1208300 [Mycena vitilis]